MSDEAVRKELREKICHDYKNDRWQGRPCDVTIEMVFDAAWQASRSAAIQECAAIADDCQCDRSAKCSCAEHAAAIRRMKE